MGFAPDGGLHIVEREASHFGRVAVRRHIRVIRVLMHACAGGHGVRDPICLAKQEPKFTDTRCALKKRRGRGGRKGREGRKTSRLASTYGITEQWIRHHIRFKGGMLRCWDIVKHQSVKTCVTLRMWQREMMGRKRRGNLNLDLPVPFLSSPLRRDSANV